MTLDSCSSRCEAEQRPAQPAELSADLLPDQKAVEDVDIGQATLRVETGSEQDLQDDILM